MYLKILGVKHNTVNETVLQFRYFSHNMFSVEIIFEQSYYNFQTLCWRQVGCSESIGLHCINQALVLTGLCLNIVCFIADMQSVLPGWADCSVRLHMTSLSLFLLPSFPEVITLKVVSWGFLNLHGFKALFQMLTRCPRKNVEHFLYCSHEESELQEDCNLVNNTFTVV